MGIAGGGTAFYSGPWREGIIQRYGNPPRITYFDTFAIADVPTQKTTTFEAPVPRDSRLTPASEFQQRVAQMLVGIAAAHDPALL